jgi:hypothetical protein
VHHERAKGALARDAAAHHARSLTDSAVSVKYWCFTVTQTLNP